MRRVVADPHARGPLPVERRTAKSALPPRLRPALDQTVKVSTVPSNWLGYDVRDFVAGPLTTVPSVA